jgi:hypothetical protein
LSAVKKRETEEKEQVVELAFEARVRRGNTESLERDDEASKIVLSKRMLV